jgi:hypothetical protein
MGTKGPGTSDSRWLSVMSGFLLLRMLTWRSSLCVALGTILGRAVVELCDS